MGAFWSTLFVHGGALYLIGNSREDGAVVIRRSLDEGRTWTVPDNDRSGLLTGGEDFSNAPTPVVEHEGRLWRAMEVRTPGRTGRHFWALMLSSPIDVDWLDARSWTRSNLVDFPGGGPGSTAPGSTWLEGNAVVAPSGQVVDVLRVEKSGGETAAVVRVSPDGRRATFDAGHDFVILPGGSVKFTIRFDAKSGLYWSLVNAQRNPEARRNRLVLVSSFDLRNWRVEQEVLSHPDRDFHAFQYADWQFEAGDLIFLSRTAWDGSHSFHDANTLTFHRITNFRDAALRAVN